MRKRVEVVQGSHGDIEVVSCRSSRGRIGHLQPCADLVFLSYIGVPGVPSAGRALPWILAKLNERLQ